MQERKDSYGFNKGERMKDLLNKIHHADCLEFMKQLPDKCVDYIFTDIPYSAQTHSGARSNNLKTMGATGFIDFACIDENYCVSLFREFERLCKFWCVSFCDWRHVNAIEATGYLIRHGVWVKNNSMPQMTGDRPSPGWEAIVYCHPKSKKVWNGGGKSSVYISNINAEDFLHPTQKPKELIKKIIKDFVVDGTIILDPFSGSGTTALACHDLGLEFICVEKDADYHTASVARLNKHRRQGNLFTIAKDSPEHKQAVQDDFMKFLGNENA